MMLPEVHAFCEERLHRTEPLKLLKSFHQIRKYSIFFSIIIIISINVFVYLSNFNRFLAKSLSNNQRADLNTVSMPTVDIALSQRNKTLEKIYLNQLYARYGLNHSVQWESIVLLLAIKSAPIHRDRRDAIRNTWWRHCVNNARQIHVRCFFFTERNELDGDKIIMEMFNQSDIVLLPPTKGLNFGQVVLYQMVWSYLHFQFSYLLLLDDDVLFCMDRFLQELPLPPMTNYHWGYVHCSQKLTWSDEAVTMFSRDLIEQFILQDPNSILCSPYGDQTFSLWLRDLDIHINYNHDKRIWHDPPASRLPSIRDEWDVCNKYIAVHGVYPRDMLTLWSRMGQRVEVTPLPLITTTCSFMQRFEWKDYDIDYRRKPQLCISDPEWPQEWSSIPGAVFSGREI